MDNPNVSRLRLGAWLLIASSAFLIVTLATFAGVLALPPVGTQLDSVAHAAEFAASKGMAGMAANLFLLVPIALGSAGLALIGTLLMPSRARTWSIVAIVSAAASLL